MTDERSDEALLAAHVDGDPFAFTVIVERHRDRLWSVALRTTGDPEEAADALQDALISAFRRASSFRGDSQVTTWLHRIVVNACLDRLRRRNVRSASPLPEDDGPGALEDGEDGIGRREDRIEIARALAELPQAQREAVLLVDVEGLSIEEAAAALGVPGGTIKSRCSRGRARLAKRLEFLRNPDAPPSVTPEGPPSGPRGDRADASGTTASEATRRDDEGRQE